MMDGSKGSYFYMDLKRLRHGMAILVAISLLGLGVQGLFSGLTAAALVPIETREQPVVLELPYRGFCQDFKMTVDGRELAASSVTVGSQVIRLSLPLEVGSHRIELEFIPWLVGAARFYQIEVQVDRSAPPIELKGLGVLAKGTLTTTQDKITLEGWVKERGARLGVRWIGSLAPEFNQSRKSISLGQQGQFSTAVTLAPGLNHLSLEAEDRAGNRTTKILKIFRDTEPPVISWSKNSGETFATPEAKLMLHLEDDGEIRGVVASVSGRPIVWHRKPKGYWLGVTPDLPEGLHRVDLKVSDAANRISVSGHEILIDSSEVLGERELGLGARGEDVRLLHERLDAAGYSVESAAIGGLPVLSAKTLQAVNRFQADEGLPVSSTVGPATIAALGPRIYVDLSRFSLVLDRPGEPLRRWSVACGMKEFPTPTGRFVVVEKVESPTWLPPKSDWAKDAKPVEPGPDNPLGTRWIGFDWGGVGIHGTNVPQSVGYAVSHGCLRMDTAEVEELYTLIDVGTPVTVLGGWENDPALKKYWPDR